MTVGVATREIRNSKFLGRRNLPPARGGFWFFAPSSLASRHDKHGDLAVFVVA
jgi:hypothetical protein